MVNPRGMKHRRAIFSLVATSLLGVWILGSSIGAQTPDRQTVWNGVYTEAQAARGSTAYIANCAPCHGLEMQGVANLKGDDFMQRWREFDVRGLYDWISKSMPRPRKESDNRPGSLSESTYVDIIAHVFRGNGFPAGSRELMVDVMKNIQIEGKDGPKPVPDGALVQSVGCMTNRNSTWFLTSASEPKRTASSSGSTEEEMKDAKARAAGSLQFRLTNLGYLGADFDPNLHNNERMQTKGLLTRQPGNNRISVTSMETIAASCP